MRAFCLGVVIAAMAVACGDGGVSNSGDLVGGACLDDRDCEVRCERGGDFPEGTCTVPCNSDRDCPDGTNCIDKNDGICLLSCEKPSDCRGGYTCKAKKNLGHGGDSLVCIDD